MEKKNAIVLTDGLLMTSDAKTAHGLIRGTERFHIIGLVDGEANAGKDAGVLLDGKHRGIPVFATMELAIEKLEKVHYLIIGVATVGGRLPINMLALIYDAVKKGISVVNGLHEYLNDKGNSIFHMDLFRLENKNEIHDLGLMDYFETNNIIIIEWPEILINNYKITYDYFFFIGISLWISGFIIELISDEQKRRFKKDDKNKELFISACKFIGLLNEDDEQWKKYKKDKALISEKEINSRIDLRNKARVNKDYKEADRIRDELSDKGVLIEDKDGKTLWKFK